MPTIHLPLHSGLADGSRLPVVAGDQASLRVWQWAALVGAGAAAALASTFLDFGLRIPGHAILRAVFPMACGLAAVPRRGSGAVMGVSALATALLLRAGGSPLGVGAATSLALTGPLLDLALWRARSGWRLYLGFAAAGLAANLAAFAVRAGSKSMGLEHLAARPLAAWWSPALVSYIVCGLAAGLVSALVWFRFSARRLRAEP
jgi:hypothetical protein